MNWMKLLKSVVTTLFLVLVIGANFLQAQQTQGFIVVSACGTVPTRNTVVGNIVYATIDTTGRQCGVIASVSITTTGLASSANQSSELTVLGAVGDTASVAGGTGSVSAKLREISSQLNGNLASTIADAANVTFGAKADARSTSTDATSITAMQVWKEISYMLQNPAALPANQSSNMNQVGGSNVSLGQKTMANSIPVVVASDQTPPLGQAVMASSQPVVLSSDQSAVATKAASGAFALGSLADGADTTLGAKADAKSTATDTTAITVMQVLKEISAMEQAPASRAVTNAGTFPTQSAITAALGSLADGADTTLGAKADAKSTATDTTAVTAMQVLKEISAMEQAPASRAVTNAGTFGVQNQGSGSSGNAQYVNCDSQVVYDTNTNGKTQLVALASSKIVYVCGVSLAQSTTSSVTVSLGSGTGTNCGTTYTAKTPAWVLSGPASAAIQGQVLPNSIIPWFKTATSEELCISTSAAVAVQLLVTYAQY